MSVSDFSVIWDKAGGRCQICSSLLDISGGSSGYAIDHNHATGDVRGLLCPPCNKGIGHLKDSPYIIKKALEYLNDNGHYGPEEATSP